MEIDQEQDQTAGEVDPDTVREQAKAARGRERRNLRIAQLSVLVSLLVAWQLFSGEPGSSKMVLIDHYYLSTPKDIAVRLYEWAIGGVLFPNTIITLRTFLLGLAIGVSSGVVLGFAFGVVPPVAKILTPFVMAVYSIPLLALLPLFVLWFGLGQLPRLLLVAIMVFFTIFFNTFSGVREVQQSQIDMLRLMGASRRELYVKLFFPAALTWMLTGLRISMPMALVGAVVTEMLISNSGLGFLLIRASGSFDTTGVFSSIFIMMTLALIISSLGTLLERHFLRWKN